MNIHEEIFDLRIESLVYGGDGFGHLPDGRAVFVPFVLPDERVKIQIREEKGNFARADLLDVITASPLRVAPRCTHFGQCGGCQYQHIDNHNQVTFKQAIFLEQLERLGKISNPEVLTASSSAPAWNYRNALQFHLSGQGRPGFQRAGSNEVVEIKECHLPCPELNEIWPRMQMDPLPGLERIDLRCGADGQVLLTLISKSYSLPDFNTDLPISAVHLAHGESVILAGSDSLDMEVMEKTFRVSAGAFFQVNPAVTEVMVRCLFDMVNPSSTMTVLDAYCGVGLFSRFLAPLVKKCVGIESNPTACRDYAHNLDDFHQVELYQGLVEEVLPMMDIKADVIIADPPRSGIGSRALKAMLALSPRKIVYVSCNPATLARDASVLASNGYVISQCRLVDMFPQTGHIEAIVLMSRVIE